MTENGSTILEMSGISMSFPGVKALSDVNFDLKKGEVHALVGENGAGKSTLMKVLAGVHFPEKGDIVYRGRKVVYHNPLEAKQDGIVIIFQELNLVPELTVAENIFLGTFPTKGFGLISRKKMKEETRRVLQELECDFDENKIVGNLSIARQQMVEIARALALKASIVILDEPTASLTGHDKDILFRNIRRLREQGTALVYVSHKMEEIFEITDRITVLRDGQKTGTLVTAETNRNEVIQKMIGRELDDFYVKAKNRPGEEALRVENLSRKGEFYDISFSLRCGEVLGLYGLVGAGRSEVAEAIFGIRPLNSGKIFINGKEKKIMNSKMAVSSGMGFVPEDRKEQGLILGMSCRDNQSLANIRYLNSFMFIKEREVNQVFEDYRDKLSLSCAGPGVPVVNLSGGNQQKIVIAKWLSINPSILILDEPTRGIDVGSKAEIHKLVASMAEQGMAILVISSEMPEIMGVSHRILTMHQGRITNEFSGENITESNLIDAITSSSVC